VWIGLSSVLACSGPDGTNLPDAISVNLHNLCSEPMAYIVEGAPEEAERTLAPGEVVRLQMGPEEKIAHYDEGSSVKGWINTDGGHVWFNANCSGIGTTDDPDADPATLDRQWAEARAEIAPELDAAD
jgi:hypothetical protein